jgi:2-polyprenyl-6-methoxyphenol hydroxylase-like FAD-dependent oxidoreductase
MTDGGLLAVASIRKALLVGGGVAGMACAIQLRKLGVGVDLVDLDPQWRSYGAGLTVTGPTLRALRSVGVVEAVIAQGATWNCIEVHNQAGEFLTRFDQQPIAANLPATGGIMRPVLHKILSTKTLELGVHVRLATTITDFRDLPGGVEVDFSDGTTASYDLVVGADGIFSKLRERVFPEAPKPRFTGQVIYRLLAERPPGFVHTHFFAGADVKVGFNPVSPTHMYMYLLHEAHGDPWIDPAKQPETLHAAMEGFGSFVPQVRETVLTTNAATVNYRLLEVMLLPAPWHRGRIVLIGDAAHATTPHLASGAGMAIEDGIVLAEEVEKRATLQEAFEHFMRRRFERCRLIIENSVELGRIEMSHGSPLVHAQLMADSMAALREAI